MDGEFRTDFVRQPVGSNHHPALVLNADYRPLSYYPLSLWSWQDAVKAAYMDRVDIVAEYDTIVRSPTTEHPQPSCHGISSFRLVMPPVSEFLMFGPRALRKWLVFPARAAQKAGSKLLSVSVAVACAPAGIFSSGAFISTSEISPWPILVGLALSEFPLSLFCAIT